MFLQAGANWRHRSTGILGWTRPLHVERPFAPAELIVFSPKPPHTGDFAWMHTADRPRFVAWGECCRFGTWPSIELPWKWQEHALEHEPVR